MQDTRGRPRQNGKHRPARPAPHKQPDNKNSTTAARREPAGFPARRLAIEILGSVIERGQPFDQQWSSRVQSPQFIALEPRDRAFVRSLTTTTLRRQGELAHVLKQFLDKPLPADKGLLWPILLSGAAQLLCLDMPAHAVVDLCVELARRDRGARRFDKLTNAVLRRVSERGHAMLAAVDGVRLNIPDWLFARWEANYGAATARLIAHASLREAALDLSFKPGSSALADTLAAQANGIRLPNGTVRLSAPGRIEELPGYQDGAWWVQDAAAALVSRALGDVAGQSIADLCAAPGGKTAALASAGAKVTAVDLSEKRLARLRANMARLQLEVDIVTADVLTWSPEQQFDAILLDAPCSATGTVRRHPDLLRQKQLADFDRLAALQGALLHKASALLRPGGRLVYSTCSLEPEEGPDQVAAFLAAHEDFAREAITAPELGADPAWITADGDVRTLPCHLPLEPAEMSGMDGFYVARLRRRS